MLTPKELSDQQILDLFKHNPDEAIAVLFRQYYTFICRVIYRVLPNKVTSEDIAQDVFFDLWRKKDRININTSLKAYLRRTAVNRTLNHIRDQKMKFEDEEKIPQLDLAQTNANQLLEAEEMQQHIDKAIESLPERCRMVFSLSRFEELSYQEIATKLEISPKTVENQISKALRILRKSLAPYVSRTLIAMLLTCWGFY